jgi:hypothetical protein
MLILGRAATYVLHTTTTPKYILVAQTTHYMKHYNTYVVHTSTKPNYIQARHTSTTRHGCGTAHQSSAPLPVDLGPLPGRDPSPPPGRDPSPPPGRDRSTQRPRPLAHRERGTVPEAVLPCPQNKLFLTSQFLYSLTLPGSGDNAKLQSIPERWNCDDDPGHVTGSRKGAGGAAPFKLP